MATVNVLAGNRQVPVDVLTPAAQASTASQAVITGSDIDMRGWRSLAYTLTNITNTISYYIYGANDSAFADETVVSGPTDIAASAAGSYSVAQAPYAYYRVKIIDKVGGDHGTVTLRAIAKG